MKPLEGLRNFLRPRVGVYPRFHDKGMVVHEFLRHGGVRGTIRPTARHGRCEGLRTPLATLAQAFLRPRFGGDSRVPEKGAGVVHKSLRLRGTRGTVQLMARRII